MRSLRLLVAIAWVGCGPATTGNSSTTSTVAAPSSVELAVLPLDVESFPRAAVAINGILQKIKERNGAGCVYSRVSLEVVQLSIECVEPSATCYTAVGKSLNAQRLLMTQLSPARKHSNKAVRVTFTLFDVEKSAAVNVTDRVFRTEEEASTGARDLLEQLLPAQRTSLSRRGDG